MTQPHDLTCWLDALRAGDSAALDEIVRVLYDELRSLARSRLRAERAEHTLSAVTIPVGTPDAEFFLVVPAWSAQEGSYGPSTAGDRAPAPGACHPQGPVDACAP